jgi:hypothetical protein
MLIRDLETNIDFFHIYVIYCLSSINDILDIHTISAGTNYDGYGGLPVHYRAGVCLKYG